MDNQNQGSKNIVMMGATGAVGTQVVQALMATNQVNQLTLLGRRPLKGYTKPTVFQHKISIFEPDSYQKWLPNHEVAICTLGVGEPSKMSKDDFLKIDKQAVLDFAKGCKKAGVKHFSLLSSVGIDAQSRSFFLRAKGELVEAIKALQFDRFSIFQPSMILTPENRYGFSQAVVLTVWPLLKPVLIGGLRKYRGVKVETLGKAMAKNIFIQKSGVEYLQWNDFQEIIQS